MNKRENYLDYIPIPRPGQRIEVDTDGRVTIYMENRGFYNRLAQRFWKRPKVTRVHLDELGSLAFNSMDGVQSIYEIGKKMRADCGEKAEPLYQRLATFFKQLDREGLIEYHSFPFRK